jgi:hypothetical protein
LDFAGGGEPVQCGLFPGSEAEHSQRITDCPGQM